VGRTVGATGMVAVGAGGRVGAAVISAVAVGVEGKDPVGVKVGSPAVGIGARPVSVGVGVAGSSWGRTVSPWELGSAAAACGTKPAKLGRSRHSASRACRPRRPAARAGWETRQGFPVQGERCSIDDLPERSGISGAIF
jgi:hypothetical protein